MLDRMRFALGCVAILVTACGADPGDPGPPVAPRATWYQDVGPIAARHCTGCHREGGLGPFSMETYEEAFEHAGSMLEEVEAQAMPPFDAREEPDCTPRFGWVDDPRLTTADKATLRAWVEDGAPAGEFAELPAPPATELQGITKTLAPTTPFVTMGDRDQFTCFILDPQVTQLTWMTGLQVRPGNEQVVHHAVITQIPAGAAQDALVAERGIGVPFDCGTMATPGDFVMSIWTPGNQPLQTPDDLAVPIGAGAKVVMQIHYHPANLINEPDITSIDLRFSSAWPKKMYFVTAIGNSFDAETGLEPGIGGELDFLIPANVADHVEAMATTLPQDLPAGVQLFSVNPHMHLIGTHIESKIFRAAPTSSQPAEECLANGAWNFDWQRTYVYNIDLDHMPSIAAGDRIAVKCRWNNTLDNPFVTRMLNDAGLKNHPPIDIPLGEETTNEMCLEIFGITLAAPAQPRLGEGDPRFEVPRLGAMPVASQLFAN